MLHHEIDIPNNTVHILGPAPRSAEEFRGFMERVFADPAFRPGLGFLRDRRGLEAPSPEVVRSTAEVLKSLPTMPSAKCAFVVDTDGNFGMIRMAQILNEGSWVEFGIFRSPSEATRWLREPLLPKAAA